MLQRFNRLSRPARIALLLSVLALCAACACVAAIPNARTATPTHTPTTAATPTARPTNTIAPSSTPRPTQPVASPTPIPSTPTSATTPTLAFSCVGGCLTQPSPQCNIKGNATGGEKIYHTPGQQNYNEIIMRPNEGDRWFCTTAEAQASGFRPAQR